MSLRNAFYIPPSDRKIAAIGSMLVVLCVAVFKLADTFHTEQEHGESIGTVTVEKRSAAYHGNAGYAVSGRKAELFEFDPNTADSTQLLRLGLKPWMVRNIYRYRAAGGVYRKPSDFARLYGLTKKQYETLVPYIRISDDYLPAAEVYGGTENKYTAERNAGNVVAQDTLRHRYKLAAGEFVQLNTADSMQLKRIPGIGTYYAKAILRYRERLGGFYSPSQLLEIDGVPESSLHYVKTDEAAIRKINLNKLTFRQLRQHPYLNYYQVRDIVDYRRLHGKLSALAELRLLNSFTKEDIERLRHYVEF